MASIRRLTTSAGAARYEIRWRPAPGQAERSRRFASLETARAFKAQTEAAQTRGVVYNPTGGRVTFRRYAEQWLEGRPLAETTRDNYAETLERHVYPTFAGTPIGKLTADEIRRWHRPPAGAHSVHCVPRLSDHARRLGHRCRRRADSPQPVPHQGRQLRPPQRAHVRAGRGRARPGRYRRSAHPGDDPRRRLRRAALRELRGLRLRHYDRLKATLTVREAIDKRSRRKAPKTESSQRTVVLPRFVLDAIDEHLTEFVVGDPDSPLFPGEAGGIISDGWFQREWRLAKRTLGLPEMHFHDLRHTAGTIATQQGATMKEVMARLGHSTTSAAIRYQKAAADRDQVIADKLDDLVAGLRTAANADGESSRPAPPAGFPRGAGLSRQQQSGPKTQESPAIAGDSLEHPQRDSNPCRHLERDRQLRFGRRRPGRSEGREPLCCLGPQAPSR